MKLADLFVPWINTVTPNLNLLGLHHDSRQIKPGFLFIAYPGATTDGRLYIQHAIDAGAIALVYEPNNWPASCELPTTIPCIALPDLAQKLASIACRFYDNPSKKLTLTGITGTNGKTTIAYQLAQAHSLLKQKAAYIGTIGQGQVHALEPLVNTTPDALCLQHLLQGYQQQGLNQVCMEVSSHALAQKRVEGINFQQAIFTNLSHDHLDFHQSMEAYALAKAQLFALPSLKMAILNQDDEYSAMMRKFIQPSCSILTYGIHSEADIRALSYEISMAGTKISLTSPWGQYDISINALGFFNVYNALAVFSSLLAFAYPPTQVVSVMSQLQAAPGRMEIISKEPYTLVDYAHSPDALANVLTTLASIKKGRLIVVFGCGGDRDTAKRPMMGKIASQYADVVIITSDNPRSEDPMLIIHAIESGISAKKNLYKIASREEAIAKAISIADKDDIILVAGKGHEAYQQIGQVRKYFSDQDVIRRLIK